MTAPGSEGDLDVAGSLARGRLVTRRKHAGFVDYYYSLRALGSVAFASLFLWLGRNGQAPAWSRALLWILFGISLVSVIGYARAATTSRRFWQVKIDEPSPVPLIDRCRQAIGGLRWRIDGQGPDWLIATVPPRPKEFLRVVTILTKGDRLFFNSRRPAENGRRAFLKPGDDQTDLFALLAPLGQATIDRTPRGRYQP